jgi:anti-sigma B factor antagonist
MFDLECHVESGTLIVDLKGRLDDKSAQDAEQRIFDLLKHNAHRWVVNLAAVEHISGNGLRVLLGLARKLSARRRRMVLCSPRPDVEEVFWISGFNRIFRIVPSLADALHTETTVSTPLSSPAGDNSGLAETVAGLVGTSVPLGPLLPASEVQQIADMVVRLLNESHAARAKEASN